MAPREGDEHFSTVREMCDVGLRRVNHDRGQPLVLFPVLQFVRWFGSAILHSLNPGRRTDQRSRDVKSFVRGFDPSTACSSYGCF